MKMLKGLLPYLSALALIPLTLWFVVTQPVWVSNQQAGLPEVKAETLRAHVDMLSTTLPGRVGMERELEPTLQWLEQQLTSYGTPRRQSYTSDQQQFHNLVLSFGPESGPVLVIGAHYDTAHGLPGADDNASGVAGLLELARLLSATEIKRRIELVFYTLEESRFYAQNEMGSYIHAAALKRRGADVELMVSLEMIGYFSDQPGSQLFPSAFDGKVVFRAGQFHRRDQ